MDTGTRRPTNMMTHRAHRPERGITMKRNYEMEELLENINKLLNDESIHHLLIVSRALLQIEREKRGE